MSTDDFSGAGLLSRVADLNVLGILAGTDIDPQILTEWALSADVVLAADGAANRLLAAGIRPDAIVGDLDSLDPVIERANLVLVYDEDQETTDCDKLLAYMGNRFAGNQLSLTGIEGDRFDHVIASVHSYSKFEHKCRLVLRDGFAWCLRPCSEMHLATVPGQTVSILPILPCSGLNVSGLRWQPRPILTPGGSTSISNEATGTEVSLTLLEGTALVTLQADIRIPAW
ncbi:MAG TPA: thiamine diphosphokinase [Fimbriimonadaceae bacterium]|nr:thiamine diphosphokinase [Fimbriimonadaceae bacterium]